MIDNANLTRHYLSPSHIKFILSSSGKGVLAFLLESILHDHLINNLATENASPPEKFFAYTVKFFEDHYSATTMTLHFTPPILKLIEFRSNFHTKGRIFSGFR